ncbi:hypothetical protein B0H14DRAFT_2339411 [Mycena olivaceomarginata]|nr:hypothetical protein B0H14DRAFT_2339411 [Mycena olivaceomarginata]
MNITWEIRPVLDTRLTWGVKRGNHTHSCRTCGIILLTGESSGFRCGPNGARFNDVKPLPELPPEYSSFINDPRISHFSRILNLVLSFASLETTHPFPDVSGPPSFLAIQGRVYHRVRPSHENSAVRWLLYDGFLDTLPPHTAWASTIPTEWIDTFKAALLRVNRLAGALKHLGLLASQGYRNLELQLEDTGTAEIAAIMSDGNPTPGEIKARRMIVVTTDGENQSVSTLSRFWEPLAYPLLFPHGTLGWGVRERRADGGTNSDAPTTQIWHYRARLLREPTRGWRI